MKEKIHRILLVVIAWISAIGLTINMDLESVTLTEEQSAQSFVYRSLLRFRKTLPLTRLLTAVVFFAVLWLLFYTVRQERKSKADTVLCVILSAVFAFFQLISVSYTQENSSILMAGDGFRLFRSLLFIIGYGTVAFCIFLFIFRLFDRLYEQAAEGGSISGKKILTVFLLILLCWLPYYILFFPGTGNGDTSTQIMMFLHIKEPAMQKVLNVSSVIRDDIYISNHHPFFTTIIFGSFAKLGLAIGNKAWIGVAIYCFLQMALLSFEFSYITAYFESIGADRRIIRGLRLFIALFPMFPLYAVCVIKDTMFALCYLPFVFMLFRIVQTKGNWLKHPARIALFAADSILICLTKSQGAYIAAVIGVLIPIYLLCIRNAKAALTFGLSLLIPVILYFTLWTNVLLPAWNVAPAGRQEAIGILFQQTARYVSFYPDDVSAEEESAIRNVIDYDHLAEKYDPELADGVKFTFNQQATDDMMKAYYSAWWSMFKKHPMVYVDAVINNCYGCFYLNRGSSITYREFILRAADHDELIVENKNAERFQDEIGEILYIAQRVPILGLLFNVGSYTWVTILCFVYLLKKKERWFDLANLFALLSIAVLLISPANGNFRYAIPMFLLSPITILMCVIQQNEVKNG